MYGALDISTSGLVAQRTRLTIISNNLANRDTLLDENGAYAPYRRQYAVFSPAGSVEDPAGVRVATIEEDPGPLRMKYEPGSPWANEDGYVGYPNVHSIVESMDAMEASRAYEANISAAEATKSMITVALQLLG